MLKNSFNIKHITSPVNNWKGCTSWRQRNKSWRHIILWLSTHCHEINREAFTYPQSGIVPSYPMTERIYSIYRYMPLFAQNAFHPSKICKCGRLCAVNKQSLQTWFLRQSMHLNFSTSGWKQMEQLSPEWQYDGIRVALICSIVLFGLLSVIYPWHNGCYCILKHDYKNEKHVTEMKKNHNWNVWFWS